MKVFTTALATLWLGLGGLLAQNPVAHSLQGHIYDAATREPLTGATVYIPDLKKGTSAGVDGGYLLQSLPTGTFLLEVRLIGYKTLIMELPISGQTQKDFSLEITATELHDLVVTGVSHATEIRQSPVPTLVLNKTELLQNSATNVIDALSRQPGVSQISTGVAISKPLIRGLGYNRVVTLNNGLRQEGQQWGDEHGIEIDEYAVDQVEIIKGPGSLMYGSDAMAGVINLLAPKPVDDGKIIGAVYGNYQSNNNLLGWSAMTAGNLKGINWLLRGSQKAAGNYRNAYDGKVYNSGFNEWNLSGMVGINRKWGYTHLGFSSFNQNIGMVEGERDSTGRFTKEVPVDSAIEEMAVTSADLRGYRLAVPRQHIGHVRVSSQSYFIMGKSRLGVNLSWQQNRRKEFGEVDAPDAYGLFFLLNTFTYDIKYHLPILKGWQTVFGLNGMYQNSQNKGTEFIIPAYSLLDYGLFGVTKRTFGKFTLSGGVRFDQRFLRSEPLFLDADGQPAPAGASGAQAKFTRFGRTFYNVSGSVGGAYVFSEKWSLKLNVSRGFRTPNPAELASNGKHEGTLRYELGNTDLKPETSLQIDLGAGFTTKHVTVDAALFQNFVQRYIYLERLSAAAGGDSIVDPADPTPTYAYRQGRASLTGGEITVDFHPHPWDWLHFENSFSYVRGVNVGKPDSAKYLPFMPPAKYRSELKVDFRKVGKQVRNLYGFVQFDYFFRQNNVLLENNTERPAPAYWLLNLGTGTDVTNRKGRTVFSVFVSVNNLLNKSYQSALSRLRYAAPNPVTGRIGVFDMGRNISVKVVVPIEFKK